MTGHVQMALTVGPSTDYETARQMVIDQWGDDAVVIAGRAHRTAEMTLLSAQRADGSIAGMACYRINGAVALLGAMMVRGARNGVGSALFEGVLAKAREAQAKKLRAITTNDNFEAMRFYQKHGMRFMTLFAGGVDAYRAFRPGIRRIGNHGIVCRDVLELEMDL